MNKFKNNGFIYEKIATSNDADIWTRSTGVMFVTSFYTKKNASQKDIINSSSISSMTILDAQ